jgi:MFS transporter, DHA2 family, multidrug resistance protein
MHQTATRQDGLTGGRLYLGVLALTLATSLGVLDGAVANVALPTMANTLHTSPSDSVWIINAYQLSLAASLLPLSSLGDRVGYRRIYLYGLSLFTFASLMCALAHSLEGLVVARGLQGFGAAGIVSVNTALVKTLYPARLLGRGVSINASVIAVATAAGPSIAAVILSVATWPWLFALNVPIGLVAIAVSFLALPRTQTSPAPYDYTSALLNVATLGLLVFAVEQLGHSGISGSIAAQLLGAVVCAVLLVRRERHRTKPMLPVDLLLKPAFLLAILTSICSFVAQMLAFVSLPFLLQDTLGHSTMETGALITPWPLAVVCTAPLAGLLSDRYRAGTLGGVGLATLAAGLALLALLPQHPTPFDIGWRMAVSGAGFGLFQTPNNRAILAAAPPGRTGNASGMIGTARLLGQTLGAVLTALIFVAAPGHAGPAALFAGAGFAAVAACFSLSRMMLR